MTVRINELIIRAEIVTRDDKREEQIGLPPVKSVWQTVRQQTLNEDKKKRER
jgi:hypothetical protein